MSNDKTFIIIIGSFLMIIILGLQGIAVRYREVLAATISDIHNNIITDSNSKNIQNNLLITKILAKNLENHIQKSGAILNITSKLHQVINVPFAHLLNQTLKTLHGIPQQADIQKRQIAKNIIASNNGVIFVSTIDQAIKIATSEKGEKVIL